MTHQDCRAEQCDNHTYDRHRDGQGMQILLHINKECVQLRRLDKGYVPCPTKGDAAATTASAPETFMSLKKSHALEMSKLLFLFEADRKHVQFSNDPLHDTQVVHHLHKRNEKYYGAQLLQGSN